MNLEAKLSERINMPDIQDIVSWVSEDMSHLYTLVSLALAGDSRVNNNALWCLTHLPDSDAPWLQSLQNILIDRLLGETVTARKRMLLQILRGQEYEPENIRTDFLDFCLSHINAECEPYAVRCFCLYTAYKMCRHYPELVAELRSQLEMLSMQSLSPGMKCAYRKISSKIKS
ncbi:MAG: hypothetical protein K2H98_07425 [Duncaniella sp.]|nr:hypothetical protein [Duncaniella sp.]